MTINLSPPLIHVIINYTKYIWGVTRMTIGGYVIDEQYFLWAALITGPIALYFFTFAVISYFQEKRMKKLEGVAKGKVTGLLKSHLFRNETHGDVPGGVIMGWGVAQGEQYWGGTLKIKVPPWFPCVRFEADGNVVEKLAGEGTWKGSWEIGQQVTVRFDPKTPKKCYIEGDPSYKHKRIVDIISGCIATALCISFLLILAL